MQLRVPGPTPLPPQVQEALARQMFDHRGPEFTELMGNVTARMKKVFQTSGDLLTLTSSGTGVMEAAIVNVLSPGDRVLSVSVGAFGDRFGEIAQAFGADVVPLAFTWGQAAAPDVIAEAIKTRGPFKAVLVTHNETSTGVTNDLAEIAKVVHGSDALLLVDGISSVSSIELKTDAWGCDIVLSGSQKGWMVPPGLAMVSVSARAWEAYKTARMPRFYWDFEQARKYLERNQTPATPAVSILVALRASLDLIDAEGIDQVYRRHARIAAKVRAGIEDLGLDLLADESHASNTVTAVRPPPEVDVPQLLKLLRADGIILATGQGPLAGKIFRIGHLGWIHDSDVDEILAGIAKALPLARRVPAGGS